MLKNRLTRIAELLTGLATITIGVVGLAGENDLYSDVQAGRVFATSDTPKGMESAETPQIGRRITSLEQLSQLVRDASFEPKTVDGRTVTTSKTLEPWLFPVSVTLSDDELHLQICVALGAVTEKQKVDAGKVLALLEANKLQASAKFGFNASRSRTELLTQIVNDGVSAESLRDEINRLTSIAKATESLWQIEAARTQSRAESASTVPNAAVQVELTPPAIAPMNPLNPAEAGNATAIVNAGNANPSSIATDPVKPVANPSDSSSTTNSTALQSSTLTGRWSASRATNEAFAILFDANGSFVFVSIRDGKQAKTTGRFTVVGTQLTLEGADGVRLSGTIAMTSATAFSFQPSTTTGIAAAFNFRRSP